MMRGMVFPILIYGGAWVQSFSYNFDYLMICMSLQSIYIIAGEASGDLHGSNPYIRYIKTIQIYRSKLGAVT